MTKNILIGCVVMVAIAIAYKMGTNNNGSTNSTLENASKEQLQQRVINESKRREAAEKELEISRLRSEIETFQTEITNIEERIKKDETRIFKRISRSELLNLSVQVTEYRREITNRLEKINKLNR